MLKPPAIDDPQEHGHNEGAIQTNRIKDQHDSQEDPAIGVERHRAPSPVPPIRSAAKTTGMARQKFQPMIGRCRIRWIGT